MKKNILKIIPLLLIIAAIGYLYLERVKEAELRSKLPPKKIKPVKIIPTTGIKLKSNKGIIAINSFTKFLQFILIALNKLTENEALGGTLPK